MRLWLRSNGHFLLGGGGTHSGGQRTGQGPFPLCLVHMMGLRSYWAAAQPLQPGWPRSPRACPAAPRAPPQPRAAEPPHKEMFVLWRPLLGSGSTRWVPPPASPPRPPPRRAGLGRLDPGGTTLSLAGWPGRRSGVGKWEAGAVIRGPPSVLPEGDVRPQPSRRKPSPRPLPPPGAAWAPGGGGGRAGHIWDSLDPGFAISEAPHPGACDQDLGGSMEMVPLKKSRPPSCPSQEPEQCLISLGRDPHPATAQRGNIS